MDETGPLANVFLVSETDRRPALILGTSSDRIGTPSGRGYYATLSKDVSSWIGLPIAPYAGVFYGTYEGRARIVGGVAASLGERFSTIVIFDGKEVTPSLSWDGPGGLSLTLLAYRFRNLGGTVSWAF